MQASLRCSIHGSFLLVPYSLPSFRVAPTSKVGEASQQSPRTFFTRLGRDTIDSDKTSPAERAASPNFLAAACTGRE